MGARAAVDVGVEGAGGHRAQVEGDCAVGPELLPAEPPRGQAGEADEGIAELGAAGRGQRPPVDVRSTAADRLEARTAGLVRSEEHTSELQALMRNSYAVFCLKKKT